MSPRSFLALLVLVGTGALAFRHAWLESHLPQARTAAGASTRPVHRATLSETAHYTIRSSATPDQTRQVGEAAEQLRTAWLAFFADAVPTGTAGRKLSLVLYRDQREFKAHNRSRPWAEAYYLAPDCHAYYAAGETNPHHWMLHEATHQLNREVAGFRKAKWTDEGLASYFGASRIDAGALHPGAVDRHAYPIWWLPRLELSGDLAADIRTGRIIPLRDLIADTGPPIGEHVNLYYIEYWSLTHFLLHHDGGRHADAYRTLIAAGGSLADFERLVGPVERIEAEWYAYLLSQQAALFATELAPIDQPSL
jgi:hypothetical protein